MKNKPVSSEAASAFGRLGGLANVKKNGRAHMKKISKKAVKAKRDKKNAHEKEK